MANKNHSSTAKKSPIPLAKKNSTSMATKSKWTKVYEDTNAVYYIDKSTIYETTDNVELLSLLDFKTEQRTPEYKYLSLKAQVEFDCRHKERKLNSSTLTSGKMGLGNVVYYSDKDRVKWQQIKPDSVSIFYWRLVCGK